MSDLCDVVGEVGGLYVRIESHGGKRRDVLETGNYG